MAQIRNLVVDQGTTYVGDFTVFNNVGVLDLTAYSVRAQIKKTYTSLTGIVFPAQIVSPATGGNVRLTFTPTQSRAIKAGRYVYDIEVYTTADADVIRVCEGLLTISPAVYQP